MTDAGAPRSRRERRALERRDASPEFDDLATGETEARGSDGRKLSRRERRALERTVNPMETWTAEEEMLATGQLPAMTPEVIAAEERAARERAEQSAREAEATSSELRRDDIERQRLHGAEQDQAEAPAPVRRPTGMPTPESPSPESSSPESSDRDAEESPTNLRPAVPASWPAPAAPQRPTAEPRPPVSRPAPEPFAWPSGPAQSAPRPAEPSVDHDAEAAPAVAPEHSVPDAGHVPQQVQPEPVQPEQPVAPAAYTAPAESAPAPAAPERAPFTGLGRTPGESSSAAAPAESPAPQHSEPAAGPQPSAPVSADQHVEAPVSPAQPQRTADPAAAVRPEDTGTLPDMFKDLFPAGSPQARMMEEGAAYARAQAESPSVRTPIPIPEDLSASHAVDDEADDEYLAAPASLAPAQPAQVVEPRPIEAPRSEDPAAEMRRLADEAMANLMGASTRIDSHTVDDVARAAGEAVAENRGEVAPHERELPDGLFHDAPAAPSPVGSAQPFVNLHTDGSTTQVLPPVAPFGSSASEPATDRVTAAPPGFNPDDYVPSSDIPMPDFSALEQAAHPNTASGATGSGEIPYVAAPVTDGIEVPRREVPQLQPGHGARDMHWAHFLVIGAVAFVLGLLVYQLAGLGS